MVANGAPILVRIFLHGPRFNYPLDCNIHFFDGRPLLGHSKTFRGFVAALITTPVIALALDISFAVGLIIALFSMLGDIFSSFIKRRLGWPPSSRALGLDQVPESLFPLLACNIKAFQQSFILQWTEILLVVLLFFILELLLSKILYQLHVRKQPY